ncbi:hypothetical protein AGIG_G10994 [Arapaima gigas]
MGSWEEASGGVCLFCPELGKDRKMQEKNGLRTPPASKREPLALAATSPYELRRRPKNMKSCSERNNNKHPSPSDSPASLLDGVIFVDAGAGSWLAQRYFGPADRAPSQLSARQMALGPAETVYIRSATLGFKTGGIEDVGFRHIRPCV